MAYLILVSFLVLLSYLAVTCVKYGIPNFISEGNHIKNYKWAFSIVMVLTATLLNIAMLFLGKHDFYFLSNVSAICLYVLAAKPHYKSECDSEFDSPAEIIAGLCSQAWCFLHCWQSSLIVWLFLVLVFAFGYKYIKQKEKPLKTLKMGYWAEVTAFANVYITLAFLL